MELSQTVDKAGDPMSAIVLTEVELLDRTCDRICARQFPLLGPEQRDQATPAIRITGVAAYLGSLCRTFLPQISYLRESRCLCLRAVADASAPTLDSICNPNLGMDCSRASAVNIACGGS